MLSACRGVTDALLGLVARAEAQDDGWRGDLDALRTRHNTIAESLLSADARQLYMAGFDRDRHDIEGILHTVKLTRSAAQNVRDLIAGYGEIWSTKLFREFFSACGKRPGDVKWIDARQAVVVEWGPLGPAVHGTNRARSSRRWWGLLSTARSSSPVSSPANRRGVQTTLGRNGSDFSGSIFGSLLDATEIHIWTDVDGVLSADPRRVPDAKVIDALSYNEAMELAYFGAKVIHPQTMAPAVGRGIPIWIRNTFAPQKPGSLICATPDSKLPVKGITSIENIAMVNVEGAGMIGVPGTAHRLFGALREEGISVILISQGSSEHSICFAIPGVEAERAARVVAAAFDREIKEGQIQSIQVDQDLRDPRRRRRRHGRASRCLRPGVQRARARRPSTSMPSRRVRPSATSRWSSTQGQRRARCAPCIRASTCRRTPSRSASSARARWGVCCSSRSPPKAARLRDEFKLDLRLRGIMASKKMLLAEQGIRLDGWKTVARVEQDAGRHRDFVEHLHVDHLPHTVIIDCTADESVAKHYADWLEAGIHVVTPNKKANSGPLAYYESLKEARRARRFPLSLRGHRGRGPARHPDTARPARDRRQDLAASKASSPARSPIYSTCTTARRRSREIVKDAKAKGYTEPDPRDDLSGTDFVRKVIILGREMGLKLEMKDVQVESLIPAGLEKGTIDDFLNGMPKYDDEMKKRFDAAAARGKVLRYMGRLTADGKATVGVAELDRSHAFANIALTDNVVRYATARYNSNPLIVQGPGAGPEVTAAGVFADLLRVCSYLGAHL